MKYSTGFISLLLLVSTFTSGCTDDESLTAPQRNAQLLTRTWTGVEFLTLAQAGVFTLESEPVLEFRFSSDGTFFYLKPAMGSQGAIGRWAFDESADSLKISWQYLTESFSVKELTTKKLVLGDTTSRGFSLTAVGPF